MQLQIECISYNEYRICYLCQQYFQRKEASIIFCDDQGKNCDEACTHCIAKGYAWMQNQFQQLNHQIKLSINRETNNRETNKPIKV